MRIADGETITKKICLVSLGCPKNLVDAEIMLGLLREDGFSFTRRPEEGDVIVVNTCGFIEESKTESIDQLLEMAQYKEEGRCRFLIASGCLSQRYAHELSQEMPEVDLFVGTGEFDKISKAIKDKFRALEKKKPKKLPRELVSRKQILPDPDLPRILATPRHYSYLKISEGCSHQCSFCIIPAIRGGLKSRTIESVVQEVKNLVGRGVKEFNMIAQDLNEYGRDLKGRTNLARLIPELDKIEGDFWLRPLYMYPLEFSDYLIDVLRDSEHVVKYVDIPLQHINERILLSMRRGSPSRYVRQLLTKLKTSIPDIAIRTTLIAGYPGETNEEFQELVQFIEEYEFDRMGVFKYSPEEGTAAALLKEQVPDEVKEERYHQIMSVQQKISHKKNKALLGKKVKVLCDSPMERQPKVLQGRIYSQAPEIDGVTYVSGGQAQPGEFVYAHILKAGEYDLVGKIMDESEEPRMVAHF